MLEFNQKTACQAISSLPLARWLLIVCLASHTAVFASEGGEIYKRSCAVCHADGIAGMPDAPKINSRGELKLSNYWYRRLFAGREILLNSVLNGKGAMPPKGGDASLSDWEAEAALDYMLSKIENASKPAPSGKLDSNNYKK